MTTLLVLILLGAVIYLDRRVGRLQQAVDDLRDALHYAPAVAAPTIAPYPMPEAAWPEAELAAEQEEAAAEPVPATPPVLFAEPRPVLDAEPEGPEWHAQPSDAEPEPQPKARLSFEELFGRRLPIWAGGITLAVAGFLIVKYSIEAGLISPALRVVAGLLFGGALIAGAEFARRRANWVRDPRVAQALAGAGIASLYGSVLIATKLYGLIGGGVAMAGMALITGLALFLAVRFGPPSALLGLAGGLAAPALIGSPDPNVPLLSLYLALAVGGLTALSRTQRWAWLGISALTGGFAWGLVLLLGGALDRPDTVAVGLYLLLLGLLLPGLAVAGDGRSRVQLIAGAVAGAQMAALVATGGFGAVEWGLFGLLSAAVQVLRYRDAALEMLPPLGLLIALLLAAAWPDPTAGALALVLGGAALLYGGPAALRLWRPDGGLLEAGQLAGLALAGLVLPVFHFYRPENEPAFGALALGLSAASAALAWLGWRREAHRTDRRFTLLATASALLLAAASVFLLPEWLHAPWVGAVAVALLLLSLAAGCERLELIGWAFLAAALLMLFGLDETGADVLRLFGAGTGVSLTSMLRWSALAVAAGVFAWRARHPPLCNLAQLIAPLLAYAGLAQIVPAPWLPLLACGLLLGAAVLARRLARSLDWGIAGALVPVASWALGSFGEWLLEGFLSLGGDPMLLPDVPPATKALSYLLAPAGALAGAAWLIRDLNSGRLHRLLLVGAGLLTLVGLHCLFKQLFALEAAEEFVRLGLAERLVWSGLLLGLGALLWRRGHRIAALAAAGAGAAHHLLYSLLLHNPLWAEQAVGSWPLLSLLLPTYGVPLTLLWVAERRGLLQQRWERAGQVAQMLLVGLFAASVLRQLFHGALLVGGGVGPAEDIARSIVAILLAIGFLLWGIRTRRRDWRIASLLLMLAAVAKVFLLDASGLEGLTRIASFVALGFSLIGIGWLYARQLGGGAEPARAAA